MNKERLLRAIERQDLRAVKGLLRAPDVQTLAHFDYPEHSHSFPLDVALDQCGTSGVTPMLRLLAENNFHLNEQTGDGYRSVIKAARLRNIEALELMHENGAQLSWPITGPLNWCSAVQGLFPRHPNERRDDPKFEETLRWLVRQGCPLNNLSFGLLHSSVEIGDHGALPLLFELGADINELAYIVVGARRGTPLHAFNGPYRNDDGYNAVNRLLELGADPRIRNDKGLDARKYYESLLVRSSGDAAGIAEIERVIQLIDQRLPADAVVGRAGKPSAPHNKATDKRRGTGFGLPILILAGLMAMIAYGASNDDRFKEQFNQISNDGMVSATVIRTANVRDRPTTMNSQILTSLEPGVTLDGQWVQGAEENVRWLSIKLSDGDVGYVWEGNLEAG